MSSTDEKLDALIASVSKLQDSHKQSQLELDGKLKKPEEDVAATQLDVTKRVIKKVRRNRLYEFRRKGHKEQFLFNAKVADRIDTANRRLSKVVPPSEKDKTTTQTMEELKQGLAMINERQKHIRIANQSEYHWETVAAYIRSDAPNDEEDAKRIETAEKAAEQLINRKKRKVAAQRVRRPLRPPAQLPPGHNMLPGPSVPPARPQLNPVRGKGKGEVVSSTQNLTLL